MVHSLPLTSARRNPLFQWYGERGIQIFLKIYKNNFNEQKGKIDIKHKFASVAHFSTRKKLILVKELTRFDWYTEQQDNIGFYQMAGNHNRVFGDVEIFLPITEATK
ncbi:Uncharacterised protein [Serratia fonticola]|uniref:Uncharacterized protein n=1 Tax=Serratia fonticola TaxID=47917 RepID=A0A4U9UNA3_SERFO|nr:Uncharacterised protein [Serratia fonticola]